MKLPSLNPVTMKNVHQPNFYFSAYPLKALNLPEPEKKTYLRISRDTDGYINFSRNSKVFPMINPYMEKNTKPLINNSAAKINQPDNIEERESEWFASYE